MIAVLGEGGALGAALRERSGEVHTLIDADVEMALRRLNARPSALVAPAGPDNGGRWMEALRLAEAQGVPLVVLSSLGTVAGGWRPDIHVEEDAPYGDGAGQPALRALIKAETKLMLRAERRHVPLTVVRLPLLVGPGCEASRDLKALLDLAVHPAASALRGGLHLGDVRDVAALVLRVLRCVGEWRVVHATGHAVSVPTLVMLLRDAGYPMATDGLEGRQALQIARAAAGAMFGRPGGGPAAVLTRHWGAASLVAGRHLQHHPRGLRQSFVDMAGA